MRITVVVKNIKNLDGNLLAEIFPYNIDLSK